MTNKQFAKLAQTLVPDLPGYVIRGDLAIAAPLRHSVRGLCFESSSHDKHSFYVDVFCMPLYVPEDDINLTLGMRLRDSRLSGWDATAPNLIAELRMAVQSQAIPFLAGLDTPLGIAERAVQIYDRPDPNDLEMIAYSFARAGQIDQAVKALNSITEVADLGSEWQRIIHDRAKAFLPLLLHKPDEAQRQLDAWEADTARNLKLEALLVPRSSERSEIFQ